MIIRSLQISPSAAGILASNRKALALCCRLKSTDVLTEDFLFSKTHQERVLNCMRNASPIGLRRNKSNLIKAYAAVLIALCSSKSTQTAAREISILYTRRSIHLSRHVRQVSFPGGLQDHTDSDYIDCALRETEEEIGLPRSRIEIWGTGSLITPPNTAAIMPVIGVIRDLDVTELKLNEDEVEDVFLANIKDLIAPSTMRHTQFKSGFSSPLFLMKPYNIWGVTGYLTNTFLQCLLPSDIFRNRIKYIKPYKVKEPEI